MNSSNHDAYSDNEGSFSLLDSESSVGIREAQNNLSLDEEPSLGFCIFCTENNENIEIDLYKSFVQENKGLNEEAEFYKDEVEQKYVRQPKDETVLEKLPNALSAQVNTDAKQDSENSRPVNINAIRESTPQTEAKDFHVTDKELKVNKAKDISSLIKHCAFQHKVIDGPTNTEGNQKVTQRYFSQVKI